MGLASRKCEPCRGAVSPMSREEAESMLREIPGWDLEENATKIRRSFRFRDFAQAMEFARKVGDLAEGEGHHPDIAMGWGYCTVVFQTHKIRGLHGNDFIMAAKVNTLLP
ncbi:MAG TPA: 4a-hydroxytetrahydrobiopterin dehydratase [Candidatus Deferrimicrobiaceae bacterium]|nr:4a-hydroxytetrahydrobiopterin dehydratase [Candidatus Deferrimicrobiaceae bacterium]